MKREFNHIVATLLVVLTVSISFLSVPVALSQDYTGEALEKLRQLHGEVSDLPGHAFKSDLSADGHRKALANKINAVIHQVEAGAINGATNKLENDLMNAVTNWVTPEFAEGPDGLIAKIRYIIDLLRGIKPDFAITASPSFLTIQQGGSDSSTINVTSLMDFNSAVTLSVSGVPNGVSATFSDNSITPPPNGSVTSTLLFTTDDNAAVGTHTIKVNGASGSLKHTVDITLEITEEAYEHPKIEIVSVLRFPPTPNYDEDVTVIAQVESTGSPIDQVTLSHSINTIDWMNTTMTPADALYEAVIPHKPYQTTVSYKVYANNTAGKTAVSETYSYVVIDSRPPTISDIERSIISPNYNDTVKVFATVTEPAGASGVKQVSLKLKVDSVQTEIPMAIEGGKYTGVVDEHPLGTLVKYWIFASDEADNWAVSGEVSYTVGDEYSPKVEIRSPAPDSYLRGSTDVVVFAYDDNFENATLFFNTISVANWTSAGEHAFTWNTSTLEYPDGAYILTLNARDKAGNLASESLSATVDNTVPTAVINTPSPESFIRLSVLVNVTGSDANFDRMELKIDTTPVKTWTSAGSQIYEWKTKGFYSDGAYTVSLTVFDKAGNSKLVWVSVTVDNTAPTIEIPSWTPREPSAQEEVTLTVKITDNPMGSGVKSATLWYRNGTVRDWQRVPMSAVGGNWTASIPGQSGDSRVEFYIESSDNAGNIAEKRGYEFTAIAPPGFPLWLLALIVLIILAATGATIYWVRRRVKRAGGVVSTSSLAKGKTIRRVSSE